MPNANRRGRLPADQREARRREVLAAALDELIERGAAGVTMAGVARRADASKETLYSWFGNRDDLLGELIEANADDSVHRVRQALEGAPDDLPAVREALIAYARALLTLLTSPASIELNRAAMTTPNLAGRLLTSGRHRAGPVVEEFLHRLNSAGLLHIDDPARAYRTLYGLVVRDSQIRVLLGEEPPSSAQIDADAEAAVEAFLVLHPGTRLP
ncbi:AcrR family transcriptional regulator [Kineosphaera limosa]|uniref:Putative TetR family transcriptional regulator n=1 Tax=Kineosphaera limosa NBRC 100340 TaxID=1184609 RepID=K6WTN3_9MICO|nr:TetR/AcrR family transcriptional regulator [Kineosphaera limosa]NYE01370.1 AcrR family transcriptional regulator [Kineosphaera limosa]GAB95457.1 putative TetR family transcriptional regulator [Kineosphaera limosa NBRC 100340]